MSFVVVTFSEPLGIGDAVMAGRLLAAAEEPVAVPDPNALPDDVAAAELGFPPLVEEGWIPLGEAEELAVIELGALLTASEREVEKGFWVVETADESSRRSILSCLADVEGQRHDSRIIELAVKDHAARMLAVS